VSVIFRYDLVVIVFTFYTSVLPSGVLNNSPSVSALT